MVDRESNVTLRAPARLGLTLDEEKKAFNLIMGALLAHEPKPATFEELLWILAVQVGRPQKPKRRGKPPKWTLEEGLLIVRTVEDRLQRQRQTSADPKAVYNVAMDVTRQIPYFSRVTPTRLRQIYYEYRPLFMKLQEQFGNWAEFPNPNVVSGA